MSTPSSVLPWRQTIPVERLHPGKNNPREDPGDIPELEQLIRKQGLKQPILVVPRGDGSNFEIEDGWRRYLAMKDWMSDIPAVVVPQKPGENMPVRSILTGLVTDAGKKSLNHIERARAFGRLQKEFGFNATEIAGQVGMSVSTVTNSLMLLELTPASQQLIVDGKLTATDMQQILRAHKARKRRREGRPVVGAVWEPPWFGPDHQLAGRAAEMCDSRDHSMGHSMRRRIGAKGPYHGACGQCWQKCIESDYERVLKAEGWKSPD